MRGLRRGPSDVSSRITRGAVPLAVCLGLVGACATRTTNDGFTSSSAGPLIDRQARDQVLQSIGDRLRRDWGENDKACENSVSATTFPFEIEKVGYEKDVFALQTRFRHEELRKVLKVPKDAAENNVDLCTDTRQSRPLVLLATGSSNEVDRANSLNLSKEQLNSLGVNADPEQLGTGEYIFANFFHMKRFWIARIDTSKIAQTYLQVEHFPVIRTNPAGSSEGSDDSGNLAGPSDARDNGADEAKKNESGLQKVGRILNSEVSVQGLLAAQKSLVNLPADKLINWIDKNIAGHTQIRVTSEIPIVLVEQLVKKDAKSVQVIDKDIFDFVITSEAQGTVAQTGDLGYDPVKAIAPLFFSVNKVTSLHEKYSDMVVRQRHWVEQYPMKLKEPFQKIFSRYIQMSTANWAAMTAKDAKAQAGAIYKTFDINPVTALNKARNCTTEIVVLLENKSEGTLATGLKAFLQNLTLQRVYPMLLDETLKEAKIIDAENTFPAMDSNGDRLVKVPEDTTLEFVRSHFKDPTVCAQYFRADEESAGKWCSSWQSTLFGGSAP